MPPRSCIAGMRPALRAGQHHLYIVEFPNILPMLGIAKNAHSFDFLSQRAHLSSAQRTSCKPFSSYLISLKTYLLINGHIFLFIFLSPYATNSISLTHFLIGFMSTSSKYFVDTYNCSPSPKSLTTDLFIKSSSLMRYIFPDCLS